MLRRKTWTVWCLRITVVSEVQKSYTPLGIDVGIDLSVLHFPRGKRLNASQARSIVVRDV